MTNLRKFNDLFNIFIEGLFASHSINDSHQSRLKYFDDWLIFKLLHYGNAEIINKYHKRYKFKKLCYKKTSSHGDSFSELIDNFFSNADLREAFNKNCEKDNQRFWEYYNSVFKNILTIVSICDFDEVYINSFTQQLISYLEKGDLVHSQSFEYINIYLRRCRKCIDKKLLHRFFNLGLNKSYYHNSKFYDALSKAFKIKKTKFKITKTQFSIIKKLIFEEWSVCKEGHPNSIIISLYSMIDNIEYKKEIEGFIIKKLQESFSFDLFYQATLFELIPLDMNMLNEVVKSSLPDRDSKQASFKGDFSVTNNNQFEKVNSILNLCYKFNIDTTKDEYQPYKDLSSYYAWLIDMDGFDYEHFKPEWIKEYPTKFYYRKIYNNKLVKEKLGKILKENFVSSLEREYLNIYVRKTWDIKA